VIVDDLNRPTPAFRVVPAILRQLLDAGIAARDVGIIMAPGTHGAPPPDALVKKVGAAVAGSCRLYVHDSNRDVVKVGRTSFGTPVLVNKHVAASDFVIGVGGLYPNYTAGFGGGSKLALGVLGFRSIATLHYGHQSMGWGTPNSRSNFRRDLDEIAHMIGLRTTVSLLLSGDREVGAVSCGDPQAYYASALRSAQNAVRAPCPDEHADVVISNAYPNDVSLTFVRMKGIGPLARAPLGASRIAIASCSSAAPMARASAAATGSEKKVHTCAPSPDREISTATGTPAQAAASAYAAASSRQVPPSKSQTSRRQVLSGSVT